MPFTGRKFENSFSNTDTDFAFLETIQKRIINPKYVGVHKNIMCRHIATGRFSVQKIVDRRYCIDRHKHSGDATCVVAVKVNEVNLLINEVNDY